MKKNNGSLKKAFYSCAAVLGGLHAVNFYLKKKALSSHLLKTDQGRFYSWKYGNVFYSVTGKGRKPLLLLHSTGEVSSSYEWHAVISQLGKQYRLYIPDLPGCGRSEKPALEYTNYLYVSFLASFIRDVIGREGVVVAASGLSASFAVTAAHMYPALISRLILVNPASLECLACVPDQKCRVLRTLLCLPFVGELLYHIVTSTRNIAYLFREDIYYNPFRLSEKTITVCHEAANAGKGSGRFLRASLDGRLFNWNINRSLSSISQDVFILIGENSQNSKKTGDSYQEYCPGAKVIYISSSGKLPQLENPEGFSSVFPEPDM